MSERRRNAFDRWLAGFRPALPADPAHAPDPEARCWNGKGCRPLTRAQFKRPIAGSRSELQEIRASASFADLLFPKTELEPGVILMKDLCSVGRLFDVSPAQTEGRPDRVIEDLHQRLVPLLRDVFPQNQNRPWIAQFFVYDRHHLGDGLQTLEEYLNLEARDSVYSKHWMEVLREHYRDACDENGFFFDPASQMSWKGKVRHIRLCVWRIEEPGNIPDGQHLDDLCERLSHSLAQVGIRLTPLDGDDLCHWLSDWFGPVRKASDFPKVPLVATPLALLKGTALGDLAHRALRHGAPVVLDQGWLLAFPWSAAPLPYSQRDFGRTPGWSLDCGASDWRSPADIMGSDAGRNGLDDGRCVCHTGRNSGACRTRQAQCGRRRSSGDGDPDLGRGGSAPGV